MTKDAEDAVRHTLKAYPGSIRTLAREAGVSDTLLRLIRDGKRTATQETVEALAGAMERLADRHAEAARILRDALRSGEADS